MDDDSIYVNLYSNNKTWYSNTTINSNIFNGYVRVTPNKQYTVTLTFDSDFNNGIIHRYYIRYSPEINNKTPTIYDY